MTYLNSTTVAHLAHVVAIAFVAVAVAACGPIRSERAVPIETDDPSVTYEYTDDEGLIDASFQAEEYCRQFNSWPSTSRVENTRGRGGLVTFHCDRQRSSEVAAQSSPQPPNTTVTYSYHDDHTLIDATAQAQRHCASQGAYARSSTVTNRGGTRTVVFECVQAP